MMIVNCKVKNCPYYNQNFCTKRDVVGIDEQGMCTMIWRKGAPRQLDPASQYFKESITIVDGKFEEIKQQEKEKGEEKE